MATTKKTQRAQATVKAAKSEPAKPATASTAKTKIELILGQLRTAKGTTIEALMKVTGWQAHSVRGAMAGAIKKRGINVLSEKADGVRRYRVEV